MSPTDLSAESSFGPRRLTWSWQPAGATASSVLNVVLYQIGWFVCVLGAAAGWGEVGAGIALTLALVHLALAERPGREWPLMLAAVALGATFDTLHGAAGVLDFRGHEAGTIAPVWILALWLQFATALHFCMRWLSGRLVLASLLGFVGGPLSFLGGERLGAAALGEPRWVSLIVLGATWAVAMPVLVAIADRLGQPGRYKLPAMRRRDSDQRWGRESMQGLLASRGR